MNKFDARTRRAKKARVKIAETEATRLSVFRSAKHIYAQVLESGTQNVLVSASTLDKDLKGSLQSTGNIEAARAVGRTIAERALVNGVTRVAFDRSGFKYHGRVKALADAAREAGLEI